MQAPRNWFHLFAGLDQVAQEGGGAAGDQQPLTPDHAAAGEGAHPRADWRGVHHRAHERRRAPVPGLLAISPSVFPTFWLQAC